MEYRSVEEARNAPGLRLALTAGVPGPWSESAKAVFHVKGIPYLPVRQLGGMDNSELLEWTGRDNAPIAVYEDEPARDGWSAILSLAERIEPDPPLVPDDPAERTLMYGLCHLICGEQGFGWERRQLLLAPLAKLGDRAPAPILNLAGKYAFSEEAASAAAKNVARILRHLSSQLESQEKRGSRYFVGTTLTAVDLYWACFCAMLEPLPDSDCPMPEGIRQGYTLRDPEIRSERDQLLIDHRDFIYGEHLPPLDF